MSSYTPTPVNHVITLNGVNITSKVDLNIDRPIITRELNSMFDTLSLVLRNVDSNDPRAWQEIEITNGSKIMFGGYPLDAGKEIQEDNRAKNKRTLGCSDYGAITEKVEVRAEFTNKTDLEIIAWIFASDPELVGFDATTYVRSLNTFQRVRFNRWKVNKIMDWICAQTGGNWYIDYDKTVHYFGTEDSLADFDITDSPAEVSSTKKTVQDIKENRNNGMGIVNYVEVVGGKKLGPDVVDSSYFPNGISAIVDLINRYKPPVGGTKIGVRRNDGGPTTNLVANPSFEVNITDAWTQYQAGTGAVWASDATKYSAGTKSLKITAGTAVAAVRGATIALAAGETLTIQARVWCSTLGKAGIVLYDISGSIRRDEQFNRKTSQWETVTATWHNTTGGSVNVRVDLENVGNDSTLVAYFDSVQAEKKTWSSAYCDGSLGTGYAWSGTANNSTSTRVDMPVWTTLTVKTGGTDLLESFTDVLYYESLARLEQENFWPGIRDAVELTGRVETPIRVVMMNQASHDFYGHWLEETINAPEIVDDSVALMRAISELVKHAYSDVAISYKVLEAGLRPGQTQLIKNSVLGLNDRFMIQRVTETIGIAGFIEAEVELGAVDQSLVSYLLAMRRASEPEVEWNDNEILDESLYMGESLGLSDNDDFPDFVWDDTNWDDCLWTGDMVIATEGPYYWGTAICGFCVCGP